MVALRFSVLSESKQEAGPESKGVQALPGQEKSGREEIARGR